MLNSVIYFSANIFEPEDPMDKSQNRIYEHLSEINLSEIIEDGKSAIKYLSNTSKIAETAEKVIGNAFVQQLEDKNVK